MSSCASCNLTCEFPPCHLQLASLRGFHVADRSADNKILPLRDSALGHWTAQAHAVTWVVCLIFVLGGCSILPGHWRPGWNQQWPADKPVPDTAGSWNLTELEIDGRPVCRAGHLGWRESSCQLRRRRHVGTPTKRSAGTSRCDFRCVRWNAPGRDYGLGDKAGAFTEPAIREALGYDFQSSWIRRWFLPQNIFRYWLSDFTRSDIMVQVFNNNLYHDATFADLQPHPKILINSTVHNDHTRFTFTDERFATLHSVLAPYHVANAVNASSAFPGAFQDVTLQWYMEPSQFLHLYDGGPIDNLGVQAITEYMNRNILSTSLDRLFPKGCVIFVIDATPSSEHTELDVKHPVGPSSTISSTPMRLMPRMPC